MSNNANVAGSYPSTSKSWNNLAHLCRTWARIVSIPPFLEVHSRGPENGFLVLFRFLRFCLVMEIKIQSEYFHIVLGFGGKLGNLFPPFFKEKKVNFIM